MASIINAATSGGLVTTADTSGVLQLQTATTTAVTVDASQNVSIGTSSVGAKLTVAGVSNSYGLYVSGGSTSGQSYGASIQAGTTSADMSLLVKDYSGANTYLAVLGNGNVGVGTSSIRGSAKLDVRGETIALGDNATYYGTIGYSAGAGLMSLAAETGGGVRFLSGTTERARIPSTGGIQSVNSISVGNATPTTSGAGITFPADATVSASSNANTLDDYEEGTWTAGFATWTTAPTSLLTSYTKIGRQVTINMVGLGGVCAAGSTITGIPFTNNSSGGTSIVCTTNGNVIGFTALIFDSGTQIVNVSTTSMGGAYWTCSFTYSTN